MQRSPAGEDALPCSPSTYILPFVSRYTILFPPPSSLYFHLTFPPFSRLFRLILRRRFPSLDARDTRQIDARVFEREAKKN